MPPRAAIPAPNGGLIRQGRSPWAPLARNVLLPLLAALVTSFIAAFSQEARAGVPPPCDLQSETACAWGSDGFGQLGNGADGGSNVPDQVDALTGVVAVAGGGNHSLALLADGTLRAWGSDSDGQLGNGATTGNQPTPVAVSGFALPSDPDVVAIAAGYAHSLALLADGTLRAWGYDFSGQLGDGGTNRSHSTPVPVSGFASL
ncbi:MAG: hypothetical protein WEB00_10450 [Dehalococcoidia bacterium]